MKKYYKYFLLIFLFLDIKSYAANLDYFNQGLNFFNQNNYKEAKYFFEKDIVFNIKNEKSYLYLAKISSINKDNNQQKNYLDTVLVLNPKNELYQILWSSVNYFINRIIEFYKPNQIAIPRIF